VVEFKLDVELEVAIAFALEARAADALWALASLPLNIPVRLMATTKVKLVRRPLIVPYLPR
jgi:hypothetical protein